MALLAKYKAQFAGEAHKFTVDRNCSRLLLKRVSSQSIAGGLTNGTPERLLATVRDHANRVEDVMRLDVQLAHIAAYSSMINKEPIYEVTVQGGNVAQLNGQDIDATDVDGGDPFIAYFLLNLTAKDDAGNVFALGVSSDDTFELKVENMTANATYILYGVEEPQIGSTALQYTSTNKVQGQKLTRVNVDSLDAIVLPALPAITKVRMQFPTGEPVEYDLEQLKLINSQAHADEVRRFASDGSFSGSTTPLLSSVVVVMTHSVVWVEITSDGTVFEFTEIRNRLRSGE